MLNTNKHIFLQLHLYPVISFTGSCAHTHMIHHRTVVQLWKLEVYNKEQGLEEKLAHSCQCCCFSLSGELWEGSHTGTAFCMDTSKTDKQAEGKGLSSRKCNLACCGEPGTKERACRRS